MGSDPAIRDSLDSGQRDVIDERWLPVSEEDLEEPETLEEERSPELPHALIRSTVSRGVSRLRRVAAWTGRGGLHLEAAALVETDGRYAPAVRLAGGSGGSGSRWSIAGGRVSVSRAPSLLGEMLGITRDGRRVPSPGSGAVGISPSLGTSAGSIEGGGVTRSGSSTLWLFAGRQVPSRARVAGIGGGFRRGRTRIGAAIGARRSEASVVRTSEASVAPMSGASIAPARTSRSGSITVVRRFRGGGAAIEAGYSGEGRGLLAEVTRQGAGALLSARWRYRSWTARSVAAELQAETRGDGVGARLTWRSWSSGALADDGLLELEGRARREASPFRLKLGASGLAGDGNRAQTRERYAMFECTLARDGGRTLSAHTLRRASKGSGSRASSTTVGARLTLESRRGGRHSLLVESTRAERGASAWGIALPPSGEATLRARSRPGIWVAARGGWGARFMRLGYALERGEDSKGARPWSGSLWLRLDP